MIPNKTFIRMIFRLFLRKSNRELIGRLHGEIVAAARDPILFMEYGIKDSLEGRFEVLALHASLVLRHLSRREPPASDIAQDLTDVLFRSFDVGLREMGLGDSALRRRIRGLAGDFLGRASAYDRALESGSAELLAALSRNVYGSAYGSCRDAGRLARYVEAADRRLAEAPLELLTLGPLPFPGPGAIGCDPRNDAV
ncbi:MAG TPA: ubiquinol-cytochrome C chaperone family protein [Methylocella sp.]|nr:ubiquinol-cytochrome C chaperone family protein [Methylocella sp.]